ncbi:uncharacterized protein LOC116254520 [Nymphaea colorata]|nr:uncharacterized protein LOC116254520 [Nymphaea colorata]
MAEVHPKKRTQRRGKEEVVESSRSMFSIPQGNEPKTKQVSAAVKLLNPAFGDHYSRKPLGDNVKKVSSRPMKMLIAEEMEKETECGRRSPSIIARLMGLDTLPAQQVESKQKRRAVETAYQTSTFDKQQNRSDALLHAYERYPGESILHKIHPSHVHAMEHQEFKDVFEVQETSKAHKQHYFGHRSSKRSSKLPEAEMEFVRQKLVDGKHLSTDEKLWRSKGFHDVPDDLDSKKDLFLRVLQEPDSLFTKHLHNLQTRPSPTVPNHITVLRSRTRMELEISDNYSNGGIYWKSEQQTEGRINMQKGGGGCPLNHNVAHFSGGGSSVCLHRPCQLQSLKGDNHSMATRIVVLKPSQRMSHPEAKVFSSECTCTEHRMHRVRRSSRQDLFEEAINWQRLSRNSSRINEGSVRPKPRGSREIARAVTRQLRQSVHRSSSVQHSYNLSKEDSVYHSGSFAHCQWPHELSSRFTPSYFPESPGNMEARKHLSDRWKTAQSNGERGHHGGSSSTLGEMLGLPEPNNEKGKPFLTLGEVIGQDGCNYVSVGKEGLTGCGCSTDQSNWQFGQDSHARRMRRPRAVPFLTEGCRHLKATGRFSSVDDIANDLIAREVISPMPEWSSSSRWQPDLEEKPFTKNWNLGGDDGSGSSKSTKPNDDHLLSAKKCSTSHHSSSIDGGGSGVGKRLLSDSCSLLLSDLTQDRKQLKESVSVHESYSEAAADRHDTLIYQDLEPSDHATVLRKGCSRADSLDHDNSIGEVSSSDHCITSPRSCVTQNGPDDAGHGSLQKDTAEQPSPVSILEPPFEEEFSSSECFEKISAGLDGLRKQLHLLRMKTLQKDDAEDSDCESSVSEDLTDSCCSNADEAESKEEENMEFSFLRDTLLNSGFDREQNILSNTWYSPERPLDPCLFDQLDKKYGEQGKLYTATAKNVRSLRSERRLLFDRINEGLAEILRPCMEMYPCSNVKVRSRMLLRWGGRQLTEELWELIQTGMTMQSSETEDGDEFIETMVRKDLAGHGDWFKLAENVELIGSEIEQALLSELMVEMATDLHVR